MHIGQDTIKQSSISYKAVLEKFPEEKIFIEYFTKLKYPDGIICPKCNSKQIYKVKRSPKEKQ